MAFSEEERKERARQRAREWYWANRERAGEAKRQYRAANPEKVREQDRRSGEKYRAAGKGKRKPEDSHRYYMANRERNIEKSKQRNRRLKEADPERVRAMKREEGRRRYRTDPEGTAEHFRRMKLAWRHGMRAEDWAAMWTAQDGRCYLCGDEMTMERAHLDHDHRCCPRGKSCQYCRRGLACPECNQLIGLARDDPARLRRIADSLEIALKDADARLALKPEQETLL
jgi:hypothetical protein